MSRENVEAVVEAIDAWNRGDRDAWLASTHPDAEWSSAVLRELQGQQATSVGPRGLGEFWDEWHSLWNLTIEVSETRDLGDTVVVLAEIRGTGNASGADVDRPVGYVFELDGGLIRRGTAYLTPDEALAAVGLSE